MCSFKTFATAVVLGLTFAGTAKAADLPRSAPPLPPPLVQKAPVLVDEFTSGWYLRGDIAYRINRLDDVTNEIAPQPTNNRIDRSGMVGVGLGYKWNWLRTDLTLDYGPKTKYWGDTTVLEADYTTRIDSLTALVNIYGDLGTWYGLTPYLGIGVGATSLSTVDFIRASLPTVETPRNSRWNLAWAWMAGLSYNFTSNWSVDLGYRRLSMGDARTGLDFYGNQLTIKRLSADEIRLGVRYLID